MAIKYDTINYKNVWEETAYYLHQDIILKDTIL